MSDSLERPEQLEPEGEIERLVASLESIALDEYFHDPEGLAAAMAERQSFLDALQKADASVLPPVLRATLKQRLSCVLERDGAYLEQLQVLRDEAEKAQEQLVSGRKAVRGYGVTLNDPPAAGRRLG